MVATHFSQKFYTNGMSSEKLMKVQGDELTHSNPNPSLVSGIQANNMTSAEAVERPPTIARVTVDQWRAIFTSPDARSGRVYPIVVGTEGLSTSQGPQDEQVAEEDPYGHSHCSDGDIRGEKPMRLKLNSLRLGLSLKKYTNQPIDPRYNTWIRPFKYLLVFQSEIEGGYEDVKKQTVHLEEKVKMLKIRGHDGFGTEDRASHCEEDMSKGAVNNDRNGHSSRVNDEQSDGLHIEELQTELTEMQLLKKHWDCLFEFMERDMEDIMGVRRSIADHSIRAIDFEYLWHLFKPGDVVFAKPTQAGTTICRAYRVLYVTGGLSRCCELQQNGAPQEEGLRKS